MHSLTRNCFLGFATASALALTVASTPSFAGDPPEVLGLVGPNDPIVTTPNSLQMGECHLLRRAISRRACHARLQGEVHIDTAENK